MATLIKKLGPTSDTCPTTPMSNEVGVPQNKRTSHSPLDDAEASNKENQVANKGRKTRRRIDSDSDSDIEVIPLKKRKHENVESPQHSDGEVVFVKSKRRRRIEMALSSDESESDVAIVAETLAKPKGRKNIKSLMEDQNLQDDSKIASLREEERKRRLAERQTIYTNYLAHGCATRSHCLVLDFDLQTKKDLVAVDERLVSKLKPHQVKGVKFMWDSCFESLERIENNDPGSGCILAHCMGLGKSLQIVTLVHTVLSNKTCAVRNVLVVCPVSTIFNWANEFKMWLPGEMAVNVYEIASLKNNPLRAQALNEWQQSGGVLIIGYDMYRNLTDRDNEKIDRRLRATFKLSLVSPGPDLVICDEGHLLKNENTAISLALNRIATRRRIVLTGTPLQNSLLEYHCMVQFVKPHLLGTKKEFVNRFVNPIQNGQLADSTDHDVSFMKRRAHVLHKVLEETVQRFDYSVLTPYLPCKYEYVISVKLSKLQTEMYRYYLQNHARGGPFKQGRGRSAGLFADFQELGRVWTHPRALELGRMRHGNGDGAEDGSLSDRSSNASDDGIECLSEVGRIPTCGGAETKLGWVGRTRGSRGNQPPPELKLGPTDSPPISWFAEFVQEGDRLKLEHSGKLVLLMDLLDRCECINDKILVFSQSLTSLDLIEEFLAASASRNAEDQASSEILGRWEPNLDYFRLDGGTSSEMRKEWCNAFNSPANPRARLFLISTKAGGLGINLVAANRVVIFDASWNPSHDIQSIFRVYRFGQTKPCYVYRFVAQGTMEEKIYDRQVTKESLSCRVVDEKQIERHFNASDLNDLYVFDTTASRGRRTAPPSVDDPLLKALTTTREEWIGSIHEHDSLLANKSEEELNDIERQVAWSDFQNEEKSSVED